MTKLIMQIKLDVVEIRVDVLFFGDGFQCQCGKRNNEKWMVNSINNSAALGVPAAGVPTVFGILVSRYGVKTSTVPSCRSASSSVVLLNGEGLNLSSAFLDPG